MRLWTVHPRYLDAKGLVAVWREGLLALERITAQADSRIFSNAFTRQRGLEPVAIARDVTSVKKKQGTITHLCNDAASWSPVTVAQAIEDSRRPGGVLDQLARTTRESPLRALALAFVVGWIIARQR